jgi:putative oxidoreductase
MTDRASTAPRAGAVINIVLWVVQIALAAEFIYSGYSLFTGNEAKFEEIGFGQWLRYLTGVLEIAGGIGLLIPPLMGLAALGLTLVMAGAVITELFLVANGGPVMPLILLVVSAVVAWFRRDTILALLGRLRTKD